MSNRLWTATLNRSSPRYATWSRILGSDEVPLRSPRSQMAILGEAEEHAEVYLLDALHLAPGQRERLEAWIAKKYGVSIAEARAETEAKGHFPIRAEDVDVAYDMRAFV